MHACKVLKGTGILRRCFWWQAVCVSARTKSTMTFCDSRFQLSVYQTGNPLFCCMAHFVRMTPCVCTCSAVCTCAMAQHQQDIQQLSHRSQPYSYAEASRV